MNIEDHQLTPPTCSYAKVRTLLIQFLAALWMSVAKGVTAISVAITNVKNGIFEYYMSVRNTILEPFILVRNSIVELYLSFRNSIVELFMPIYNRIVELFMPIQNNVVEPCITVYNSLIAPFILVRDMIVAPYILVRTSFAELSISVRNRVVDHLELARCSIVKHFALVSYSFIEHIQERKRIRAVEPPPRCCYRTCVGYFYCSIKIFAQDSAQKVTIFIQYLATLCQSVGNDFNAFQAAVSKAAVNSITTFKESSFPKTMVYHNVHSAGYAMVNGTHTSNCNLLDKGHSKDHSMNLSTLAAFCDEMESIAYSVMQSALTVRNGYISVRNTLIESISTVCNKIVNPFISLHRSIFDHFKSVRNRIIEFFMPIHYRIVELFMPVHNLIIAPLISVRNSIVEQFIFTRNIICAPFISVRNIIVGHCTSVLNSINEYCTSARNCIDGYFMLIHINVVRHFEERITMNTGALEPSTSRCYYRSYPGYVYCIGKVLAQDVAEVWASIIQNLATFWISLVEDVHAYRAAIVKAAVRSAPVFKTTSFKEGYRTFWDSLIIPECTVCYKVHLAGHAVFDSFHSTQLATLNKAHSYGHAVSDGFHSAKCAPLDKAQGDENPIYKFFSPLTTFWGQAQSIAYDITQSAIAIRNTFVEHILLVRNIIFAPFISARDSIVYHFMSVGNSIVELFMPIHNRVVELFMPVHNLIIAPFISVRNSIVEQFIIVRNIIFEPFILVRNSILDHCMSVRNSVDEYFMSTRNSIVDHCMSVWKCIIQNLAIFWMAFVKDIHSYRSAVAKAAVNSAPSFKEFGIKEGYRKFSNSLVLPECTVCYEVHSAGHAFAHSFHSQRLTFLNKIHSHGHKIVDGYHSSRCAFLDKVHSYQHISSYGFYSVLTAPCDKTQSVAYSVRNTISEHLILVRNRIVELYISFRSIIVEYFISVRIGIVEPSTSVGNSIVERFSSVQNTFVESFISAPTWIFEYCISVRNGILDSLKSVYDSAMNYWLEITSTISQIEVSTKATLHAITARFPERQNFSDGVWEERKQYFVSIPTWAYLYVLTVSALIMYIFIDAWQRYKGMQWVHQHPANNEIRDGCKDFILSDATLREVMKRMRECIDKGLNPATRAESSVKCFTTYVQDLPSGKEVGKFLALDLGGTNFRILLIELQGAHFDMKSKIYTIPTNLYTGSSKDLFDHIAKCLYDFVKEHNVVNDNLPLGFTFSFPLVQMGLDKGTLVRWTKGFNANDAIGLDIVTLLKESITKIGTFKVNVVAILNDTTGTLMSCAWKNRNTKIGVILGTGTNACYVEKIENVIEFDGDKSKPSVIINSEWGAFGDLGELEFIRTKVDRDIDEKCINPGLQLHEKLISGMYLGEIVRRLLVKFTKQKLLFNGCLSPELNREGSFETSYISEVESDKRGNFKNCRTVLCRLGIKKPSDEDCHNVRYVCEVVSRRAAHLASAGLSTILNKMQEPSVTIGVDGTLYRLHPHFHDLMVEKISLLIDPTIRKVDLMLSTDGSGRGAALVAASTVGTTETKPI